MNKKGKVMKRAGVDFVITCTSTNMNIPLETQKQG